MTAPLGATALRGDREPGLGRLPGLLAARRQGPEPQPGQFYMLAAERHWEERGRPPLPAPRALGRRRRPGRRRLRLDFLVEGIGPGTERLCELEPGERVWVNGPLGNAFSEPGDLAPGAAGAILVGGGIGIAPLALCGAAASRPAACPPASYSASATQPTRGGLDDLFSNCQIGLASDDGHLGERGYVTDLLAAMLEGDDATSAAVYACGPPAMLEAVAALCAQSGASPASWPWSRRWPAASAPASAAPSRSPPAATCASASTARWYARQGGVGVPVGGFGRRRGPCSSDRRFAAVGTTDPLASGVEPGIPEFQVDQRLGHVRRDRRQARLRRCPAGGLSLRRLRLEDDHA